MARKNYPFNERDSKRGMKLISSLFSIPISLGISSLFSSGKGEADIPNFYDDFYEYKAFNEKYKITYYATLGLFSILCTAIGFILYSVFKAEMFYAIFLAFISALLLIPSYRFQKKVSTYYIFDKDNLDTELLICKSVFRLTTICNLVVAILNFHPIANKIMYAIYGSRIVIERGDIVKYYKLWDGGSLNLYLFFSIYVFIMSLIPFFKTLYAYYNFEQFIKQNPSISIIRTDNSVLHNLKDCQ